MPDNFLEHYGVKGMKWKQRKLNTSTLEKMGYANKMASKQSGSMVNRVKESTTTDHSEATSSDTSASDKMKKGEEVVSNILLKLGKKKTPTRDDSLLQQLIFKKHVRSAQPKVANFIGATKMATNKVKRSFPLKTHSVKAKKN